ncbi:MAG TPA: helix-turn-helix transcriptional regulator [Acidimicrobiales bacterium]|nr:helix-turn-helix transcriptional regulator [Acidimicrobiales bacterium]
MKELESRWRDLGGFIREQRMVGQISLRKLSEMAGISNPYLSQIERGLRKPSAEILQQIAKALRISAETLYVRAGILEEREGDEDVTMALLRDPLLSEDQKQTLLHVYRSFVVSAVAESGDAPDDDAPDDDAPDDDSAAATA